MGRVKVVCWGFWGSVDVKFRVWVMMMKMVGCLGYVGRWVREKRCYGFHIETVEGNGCLHSLFESYFKPFYSCFSPHSHHAWK